MVRTIIINDIRFDITEEAIEDANVIWGIDVPVILDRLVNRLPPKTDIPIYRITLDDSEGESRSITLRGHRVIV